MTSGGIQPAAPFDVNDVQGDVVPGFKTGHRRFLIMKIDEPIAARHALGELADRVTKSSEVQEFRDRNQRAEAQAGPWLNVALSRTGCERLGIEEFGTQEQKESFENGIEFATGPPGTYPGLRPRDELDIQNQQKSRRVRNRSGRSFVI